jgi:hypothetical protein
MTNYTVVDAAGLFKAAMWMSLFVFVPGYAIGWALNILDFRARRTILKVLLSVPVAIACCPIATYLCERANPNAVWVFYGVTWAGFAGLFIGAVRRGDVLPRNIHRRTWRAVIPVVVWSLVVTFLLVDVQIGGRLYFSVPAFDYSVRSAFTAAVSRAVPPANPLFTSDPPVLLRYHYFWLLLCSLATRLAGIEPRFAMFGATLWCGFGVMSIVALYVKFFLRPRSGLERKVLIGMCLLLVTGLDVLPSIYLRLKNPMIVMPDMEWWNASQITSWLDSMIWVPHHVAALIACLTGFLVLYVEDRRRITPALIAGMSFASAVGLSVYVTFTFGSFVAAWAAFAAVRKNWRDVVAVSIAGMLAVLLAIPYLLPLAGKGAGGSFIALGWRPFTFATDILAEYGLRGSRAVTLANAFLLPLNYFLELGFFLLIGLHRFLQIRRGSLELGRDEATGWAAVASSFIIGTGMQSKVIPNNDLGFRCFLLAQFVLLLWAIPVVDRWFFIEPSAPLHKAGARKLIAVACLILGAIGTIYQIAELRLYPTWAEHWKGFDGTWLEGAGEIGKRTFALREAYETLDGQLSGSEVVQFNPLTAFYIPHLYYTRHPAAAVGQNCGSEFGGSTADCAPRIQQLMRVFAPSHLSSEELKQICRSNGIDVLIAKDSDPVWRDRSSWVWREQPLVANDYVRAFRCATRSRHSLLRAGSNAR